MPSSSLVDQDQGPSHLSCQSNSVSESSSESAEVGVEFISGGSNAKEEDPYETHAPDEFPSSVLR